MMTEKDKRFGAWITRLIQEEDLSREESKAAFTALIGNEVTEMQQGGLLAALTAKGETADEVAGAWEAIYALDTRKVTIDGNAPLAENSGTGMDSLKTFNISTAAAILAAAGGVRLARHGARAITSSCGTVDMAEALGVDVECDVAMVADSIRKTGLGLFNGMSAETHPRALFRVLSNICFGSTLNIAASLANPAMPDHAVRGVYAREQIRPVAEVMKRIGYRRAIVLYGAVDGSDLGMDEASVCGDTQMAELTPDGRIETFTLRPSDVGLNVHATDHLVPGDIPTEAQRFVRLLKGDENRARTDAAVLNAGLISYITGQAATIREGTALAESALGSQKAYGLLEKWVTAQNRYPEQGFSKLKSLNGQGSLQDRQDRNPERIR
jgi:anthranilate phosphoribosyltransferase